MNRCLVLSLAVAIMVFHTHAVQANDQEFVIGVGFGAHSFSGSDDFRQGTDAFGGSDEIEGGVLLHFYGEWYVLDDVGFGVRSIGITGGRTYESVDAKIEQTASVSAQLITVQWIPLGSEDYVRFGVLGGLGAASYKASEKFTDETGQFGGSYNESETSTGTATLFGAFVDWGADSFGARFGVNALNTDLDPIETSGGGELEVDGSGAHWYFDLRWAFE